MESVRLDVVSQNIPWTTSKNGINGRPCHKVRKGYRKEGNNDLKKRLQKTNGEPDYYS